MSFVRSFLGSFRTATYSSSEHTFAPFLDTKVHKLSPIVRRSTRLVVLFDSRGGSVRPVLPPLRSAQLSSLRWLVFAANGTWIMARNFRHIYSEETRRRDSPLPPSPPPSLHPLSLNQMQRCPLRAFPLGVPFVFRQATSSRPVSSSDQGKILGEVEMCSADLFHVRRDRPTDRPSDATSDSARRGATRRSAC